MDNTKFEFSYKTKNMEKNGQSATYVWSTSGPIQNNWYFLAGVYNQSDGKTRLYVNGVLETTHWMTDTSGMASSPGKYQLGGPDGVFYGGYNRGRLPGDVRGVSIVEQAVLEPELVTLYQSGPP